MTAYYNEHDALAAATIREAINAGAIAPGTVDERDIRDVRPIDLAGFTQVHLFAGGGLWSYAFRKAGWADASNPERWPQMPRRDDGRGENAGWPQNKRGFAARRQDVHSDPGPLNGFWRDADWLLCRDPGGPRWRPVNAGTFPLAPGHPARVGGLRISGDAINPEVATGFIEAVMGHLADTADAMDLV